MKSDWYIHQKHLAVSRCRQCVTFIVHPPVPPLKSTPRAIRSVPQREPQHRRYTRHNDSQCTLCRSMPVVSERAGGRSFGVNVPICRLNLIQKVLSPKKPLHHQYFYTRNKCLLRQKHFAPEVLYHLEPMYSQHVFKRNTFTMQNLVHQNNQKQTPLHQTCFSTKKICCLLLYARIKGHLPDFYTTDLSHKPRHFTPHSFYRNI